MVTDENEIKSAGRGPGGSRKEFILSTVGSQGHCFNPGVRPSDLYFKRMHWESKCRIGQITEDSFRGLPEKEGAEEIGRSR